MPLTWLRAGMKVRQAGQPFPFLCQRKRWEGTQQQTIIHSFTYSFLHSCIPSLMHSFTAPPTPQLLIHRFLCSHTHSVTRLSIHPFIYSLFTKHLLCPGALARAPGGGPASIMGTEYHLGYLEVCVSNMCSCNPPRSCNCPKFTVRSRPNRALDPSDPLLVTTPSGTLMHL
jgi:hypothetical protein